MIRYLQPNDVIQLKNDASTTGRTVNVQSMGPFSIVALQGAGVVTVQVNNRNMYNIRSDYGIGNSYNRMHNVAPQLNNSFSSYWADTTLTADATSRNAFINRNIQARYFRLRGSSMSSTTRSTVFGHAFRRPRV